ncbi:hypothetical protein [Acinetobacter brisouii]|uniref:hypothetical protein n=1 Tax=Acinetobacter brisouii TaxID=396323 RepID=UPI00124FAB18|nr:hypothetical protein [Acinetobacter brisouii]
MLLYIIPFVLLLVIAIVLKKRSAGQQESKRKVEPKKKATKRPSTTSTDVTETQEVLTVKSQPKELDPAFRRQIEKLIQEKNFNTAEALINQALNADNSQHDLYLLLLQIHIDQNDQFSTNQLLSHLRSLNLYDVVREAEQRLTEHKEQAKPDSIQFTPVQLPDEKAPEVVKVVEPEKPTPQAKAVDFDQLKSGLDLEKPLAQEQPSALSFDQLQAELQTAPAAPVEKTEEHKPLEFHLEGFSKPEVNSEATPIAKPIHLSIEPHTTETKGPETFTTKIDFGQKTDQIPEFAKTEHHDATAHLHLESLEKKVEPTTQPEEVPVVEFKFDFTEPAAPEKQPEPVSPPTAQPEVSFTFDKLEEAQAKTETVTQPVEVEPVSLSVVSFDLIEETRTEIVPEPVVEEAIAEAPKSSVDYVVQQFPELAELNDTELNLSLAEQYIRLGAFSSARALLEDPQIQYNSDELDRAKYLLNQMAS